MLKCIAIDDEPLALRQLQGYIAKINFLKLEKAFTNAIEAQQYLAGNPIDLIFVDINMPDLSGVEFVRSLVSRPMIIFTTAYSEYASRDSNSMRSTTCSNRSASLISAARQPSAVAVRTAGLSEDTRKRSCPGSHSTRPGVHLDQSRLQNDTGTHQRHRLSGKRRRIRTAPSGRPIDHHDSFPAQEHGSGPAVGNVHAVHRSYIVNLQRIRSYVKGRVFVSDSEYIPIGENYRETFQRYIETHYQNL